jgi:hypothetical protein
MIFNELFLTIAIILLFIIIIIYLLFNKIRFDSIIICLLKEFL